MKLTIERNFDRASDTYDKAASIQRATALDLIELILKHTDIISNQHGTSILDIGSGTGFMVSELYKYFPQSSYIVNDIAPNMLLKAKQKLSYIQDISFECADAEIIKFPQTTLITSNLAFQWFSDLQTTINNLWCTTRAIAFATLLENSFSDWREVCTMHDISGAYHKYHTFTQLKDLCLSLNPKTHYFASCTYVLDFCNPQEFLYYLKALGGGSPAISSHLSHSMESRDMQMGKNIVNLKRLLTSTKSMRASYEVFYAVMLK